MTPPILPPSGDPPTPRSIGLAVLRGQLDPDEVLAAVGLFPLAMTSTGVLHTADGTGTACRPDITARRFVYSSGPTCGTCRRTQGQP